MAKRKKPKKKGIRNIGFPLKFFFVFLLGVYLISTYVKNKFEYSPQISTDYKDELIKTESINTYHLTWKDFNRNYHELDYSLTKGAFIDSKVDKVNLRIPRSSYTDWNSHWAVIYDKILKNEDPFLNLIADSLRTIHNGKNYSRHQFANIIMTFVQDIPYSFVHDRETCDPNDRRPCITNERFGIHTPTEFLYTLLGDCDTRCLLLYGLYKRFGYDPKIALSKAYTHAILLIDLPTRGQFMVHQGKKYYFWETTAKGWKAGELPPGVSDIAKWKISI